MIPWSRRLLAVSFVTVALVSGALSIANLAPRPGPAGPQHWLSFSDPSLEGDPQQNTTQIWQARIRAVSNEEPFSAYQASLLRNGEVVVEPIPLQPGTLSMVGDLYYDFFDAGVGCYPTPCPPPDGPDGLLNAEDYFRLSGVEVDTTYVIRVLWAETGEVAGEIAIET